MVSRETSGLAAGLRGLELQQPITSKIIRRLSALAKLLEETAGSRGLLGPGEANRIVPRHVLESAALARWIDPGGELIDVGSGAGLPGLVLASLGLAKVTLLDAQARRVAFLREAAHDLQIEVNVVHGRAEELGREQLREKFSFATARGLAKQAVALELVLPLVRVGGTALLVVGGPGDSKDARCCDSEDVMDCSSDVQPGAAAKDLMDDKKSAAPGLLWKVSELLGGEPPEIAQFAVPGVQESRWVTIVRKLRPTPERYPRSAAAMRRRPLGTDVA